MNREVFRRCQRLDDLFARVRELPSRMREGEEYERYQADLARYLCVLVSGFLETSIRDILGEYARQRCRPEVLRYVNHHLDRFASPRPGKVLALVALFSPQWEAAISSDLPEDVRAAVDSLVALRNQIAHGEDTGVSFAVVADYYSRARALVELVERHCTAPAKP